MTTITLLPVKQLSATTVCEHSKIYEVYKNLNGKTKMTTKRLKKTNSGFGIGDYTMAMVSETKSRVSFTFLENEEDFRLVSAKTQAEMFNNGFELIDLR